MKKKIIIILGIIILILIVVLSYILFVPIKISLIGDSEMYLEVGSEYQEPGYSATVGNKKFDNKVSISGDVKTDTTGFYDVTYKIKYMFRNYSIVRKVVVSDSQSPVITLLGDDSITITAGNEYQESGYTATDNYDGDITSSVEIESNVDTNTPGEYEIKYSVIDSSNNKVEVSRKVIVNEKPKVVSSNTKSNDGFYTDIVEGPTYIKGILIVNKKYKLPSTFGGSNSEANAALEKLQAAAREAGYSAKLVSGYRSYSSQQSIYNRYVQKWGVEYTDTVSARPGHSEHQTGLAFDVGEISNNYGETNEGKWLVENCYKYGFILRYLKGKEHITGYSYEPWHIRYVGVEAATYIMENNLTLEEYLGIA